MYGIFLGLQIFSLSFVKRNAKLQMLPSFKAKKRNICQMLMWQLLSMSEACSPQATSSLIMLSTCFFRYWHVVPFPRTRTANTRLYHMRVFGAGIFLFWSKPYLRKVLGDLVWYYCNGYSQRSRSSQMILPQIVLLTYATSKFTL